MRRSIKPSLTSAALLVFACSCLFPDGNAPAASSQSTSGAKAEAKDTSAWIIGIAQFSSTTEGADTTFLLSALPKLIVSELQSLPVRHTPPDEAAEIAKNEVERTRFAAGTELATKLDERALGFLNPSTYGAEKKYGINIAEKAVRDSKKKLVEIMKGVGREEKPVEAGADLAVKLWDGHANGKLIDVPGADLAKAAKAANVDLLVTGTITLVDTGYATIDMRGYDAALGREVLIVKSHCAVDDPEPVARDMAQRLEGLSAGRDYTRITVVPDPAYAELFINGKAFSGSSRVAYVYEPGMIHISANAPGYESGSTEFLVALGERRTVELKLDARTTGNVALATEPAEASINLDSVPIGKSPLSIGLDGSRKILTVAADGMESQTVVLPASGDANLDVKLRPSDGIGLAGRISAAKENFYWSFGWFVLSVPITTLTLGIYNGYDEAYQRSGSPSLAYSLWNTSRALAVACTLTATTAVFMVIRLVKYLKATR